MKRAYNFKDLTNQKFGRLLIVKLHSVIKKATRWECLCDCGNSKIILGVNITKGATKSCGCINIERLRLEKGKSGFNRLFKEYQIGAIKRNLKFDLTENQFEKLTKENCHYCDISPNQIKKLSNKRTSIAGVKNSEYVYNGIDRKDNIQGYTVENSLPCCEICNRAKRTMQYQEFIEYINRFKKRT